MRRCFFGDCKGICSSCVGSYPSSSILGDSSSEKGRHRGSEISHTRSPHTSKFSKLNGIISSILTEPIINEKQIEGPKPLPLRDRRSASYADCGGDTLECPEPPKADSQRDINRVDNQVVIDPNNFIMLKKEDSQQATAAEQGEPLPGHRAVHSTYSAQMTRKSSSSGSRHFPGCPKLLRSRCSSDQKILKQETLTQIPSPRCVPVRQNSSNTMEECGPSFRGNVDSGVSLWNTPKDHGSARDLRRRKHLRQIIIEPGQVNPNEVTVITIEDDDSWDDSGGSAIEDDLLSNLGDCQVRNLVAQRCTRRSSSATQGLIKIS